MFPVCCDYTTLEIEKGISLITDHLGMSQSEATWIATFFSWLFLFLGQEIESFFFC